MSNKQEFISYAKTKIKREGIDELLDFLETTDFYEAPASTRYHGSYEGGLVEHSLNVYEQLLFEAGTVIGKDWRNVYSEETIAIVALFHDLCKIGKYVVGEKWRKDENGKWESYTTYLYDENKIELGHGAQSLSIVQDYLLLTDVEKQAIYWHMGAYDISAYSSVNALSKSWENNGLAYLLSRADLCVTYVLENEKFEYAGEPTLSYASEPELVDEESAKDIAEEVDAEEDSEVEAVLATKVMFFKQVNTDEVIEIKKGEDITEFLDEESLYEPSTRAEFNRYQKLLQETDAKKQAEAVGKSTSIRKPKKQSEAKDDKGEEEELEDLIAPTVTYLVATETGEPIKVAKGESLNFTRENEYDDITLKDYKKLLAEWESKENDDVQDDKEETTSETVSEVTYWYDGASDKYFEFGADGPDTEGEWEELTKEEYEAEILMAEDVAGSKEDNSDSEATEDSEASNNEEEFEVDDVDTYWHDLDSDEFFLVEAGNALPGESENVEELNEKEYAEAINPPLTETAYFFDSINEKYVEVKKGKKLPKEYDETNWEEITKEAYKDGTAKKEEPKAVQKSRRTPTPTRRKRPGK